MLKKACLVGCVRIGIHIAGAQRRQENRIKRLERKDAFPSCDFAKRPLPKPTALRSPRGRFVGRVFKAHKYSAPPCLPGLRSRKNRKSPENVDPLRIAFAQLFFAAVKNFRLCPIRHRRHSAFWEKKSPKGFRRFYSPQPFGLDYLSLKKIVFGKFKAPSPCIIYIRPGAEKLTANLNFLQNFFRFGQFRAPRAFQAPHKLCPRPLRG